MLEASIRLRRKKGIEFRQNRTDLLAYCQRLNLNLNLKCQMSNVK